MIKMTHVEPRLGLLVDILEEGIFGGKAQAQWKSNYFAFRKSQVQFPAAPGKGEETLV